MVFTLDDWTTLAPLAVREERTAVPPTAPVIVTVPLLPPVNTKAKVPLIVLEKLMFAPAAVPPPFVESALIAAVNVTGPVIPTLPPLVVTLPPRLISVVPV